MEMKQIFLHQNLGSWPPEKERPKHQNMSSYFFSRLKLQLHSSVVSLTFLTVIAVLHMSCPKSVLTACAPAVCDLEHSNGSEYLIFCVRLMLKCDFIDNLERWFFRQRQIAIHVSATQSLKSLCCTKNVLSLKSLCWCTKNGHLLLREIVRNASNKNQGLWHTFLSIITFLEVNEATKKVL